MSLPVATGIPESFDAGTTANFTESFADYPNSTYSAKLCIVMGSDAPVTVTATTSGQNFLFTLTSALTASIPPGSYDYVIYAYTATERAKAKEGSITILQDMTEARPQTPAEAMLEAVEGAITKLSSKVNSTVSFNGQTFTHNNIGELIRARTYFKAEVLKEERQRQLARGGSDQSRYGVQFVNTFNANPWQI